MEKQDTSVFPVYNEPEVRDSSEVWLIVYRSSGNFGEIFVFTNCYFADGNLEVKNAHEAAVAKSLTEMKTEDFTAALNADDKNNGWTFVEGRTPICSIHIRIIS